MAIDNIVVGTPLVELEKLGVTPEETTVFETEETFLPRILVKHRLFKSTSEVKKINDQRRKQETISIPTWPHKIPNDESQNLWRTVREPEMTPFKIGHKAFWLIVGDIK